MNEISVEIERLVLDGTGVDPRHGERLGRMIALALQRLLEQWGAPKGLAGSDLREIVVPSVGLHRGQSAERMAERLAQALYRALDRVG